MNGIATGAALTAAVAIPTFNGGGFNARSQSLFVALAGVALVVAFLLDAEAVASAARSRVVVALVALALLSSASTAWTVGEHSAALRAGLAIGGYGAVLTVAASFARRVGPWPVGALIVVLATVEAIVGLHAVGAHSLPDAERIDGAWRPGGTFQYPPALAILQVGALPVCSALLERRAAIICAAGALAAVLAGAVLGLADSRLALALAAGVLLALIARPPGTRAAPLATAAIVATGALLGSAIFRGDVNSTASSHGWTGVARILVVGAACAIGWVLARRWLKSHNPPLVWASVGAVVLVLAAVAWSNDGSREPRPKTMSPQAAVVAKHRSNFLHGRGHEWAAAVETWTDRPLLGAGAGAYYIASLRHQGGNATRYAHDLPLEVSAELGILGLLLIVGLYGFATQAISRAVRSPGFWLLAPMAAAFLASNLVDWTWHLAGLGAIWAAATGALQGASTHSVDRDGAAEAPARRVA